MSKEDILLEYYSNNAKKLHKMANKILKRYGGLSDKDKEDFYDIANEVFTRLINDFDNYNSSKSSFHTYLQSCLQKKFNTEMRDRMRDKRFANHTGIRHDGANNIIQSLETPINEAENLTLWDTLYVESNIDIEIHEKTEEWHDVVKTYLKNLSPLQRKIMLMLADNMGEDEICRKLAISKSHYKNSLERCLSSERIYELQALL